MTPDQHVERTITIQAPRDTVFRFFTDTTRWATWWGAGSTIDARPGGRLLIRYPDGTEAAGEVLDLQAPERLSFSYGFVSGKPFPSGSSRVTIQLEPEGSGTRLSLHHDLPDAGMRDEFMQGWRFQLSLFSNVVANEVHAGAAGIGRRVVRRVAGHRRRRPRAFARAHRQRRMCGIRDRFSSTTASPTWCLTSRRPSTSCPIFDRTSRRCAPLPGHGARRMGRTGRRTGVNGPRAPTCSSSRPTAASSRSPVSGGCSHETPRLLRAIASALVIAMITLAMARFGHQYLEEVVMKRHTLVRAAVSALVAAVVTLSVAHAAEPETVMVTLHAKPGSEDALARVLDDHWQTARRLNLVRDGAHVTLRGTEDGNKTYFVEVFTWLDADIPDHAPQAILAIWKEMHRLVEARPASPACISPKSRLSPAAGRTGAGTKMIGCLVPFAHQEKTDDQGDCGARCWRRRSPARCRVRAGIRKISARSRFSTRW